jgi:anti-sigma factor RsiW
MMTNEMDFEARLGRLLKAEPAPPALHERLMQAAVADSPPRVPAWFVVVTAPWRAAVLTCALTLGLGFWAGWSGFGLALGPVGDDLATFYLGAFYDLEGLT